MFVFTIQTASLIFEITNLRMDYHGTIRNYAILGIIIAILSLGISSMITISEAASPVSKIEGSVFGEIEKKATVEKSKLVESLSFKGP